jgi:hypothetical protein
VADDTPVAVVVKREDAISASTTADTPHGIPNVYIKALSPLLILVVRTFRAFLQSLAGMLTASGFVAATGVGAQTLIVHDFWSALYACTLISLCVAMVAFIQNLLELVSKLDQSLPAWRA